jgi:hypothetical protein
VEWDAAMRYGSPRKGADLIVVDICQSLPQLEYPLATEEDLTETFTPLTKPPLRSYASGSSRAVTACRSA